MPVSDKVRILLARYETNNIGGTAQTEPTELPVGLGALHRQTAHFNSSTIRFSFFSQKLSSKTLVISFSLHHFIFFMRQQKKYSSILFFVISVFLYACKSSDNKVQDSAAKKPAMTVKGMVVTPQTLDNVVRTSGTVMAFEDVDLKAETSGRIVKIYFKEGTAVKKGDLLIKINDDDLQAQLSKSNLQIKLNEQQLARQDELLKISATSQQDFDIATNQLSSLKADKLALQAAINKTEIRAPFSGVIGLKYVSEGSYVSPTSQIASIQNINPVKIDFSIPEKYSEKVKVGDVVNFNNDATSQSFQGKVYAIEPKIDLNTRSLQVRAICENSNGKIIPGSFARVDLRLKETNDALMIPTESVIPVLKGQTVFLYKDGVAMQIPIKTGVRTDSAIQVKEGIIVGDTLITTGIMFLKSKAPVNVTMADKAMQTGGAAK